jgi:hypothetical protein
MRLKGGAVILSDDADKSIVADAVRIEYRHEIQDR